MTVVLVHGNPETEAIWDPLVDALGHRNVVRLSPPGFGAPLPTDFPATYLAYRDWLEGEVSAFEQPVDLVGHDWGGCHVVNLVMHRPELVRSWASDVVGLFDPDYVWHDLARGFQTPGDGEQLVAAVLAGTIQDRAQRLSAMGLPADIATSLATAQGPEMGRAILLLYRSARQPALADAGRALANAAARPGLSLLATEDPFVGSDAIRRRAADLAGARTEVLDGLGHCWMVQDPARSARGPFPLLGHACLDVLRHEHRGKLYHGRSADNPPVRTRSPTDLDTVAAVAAPLPRAVVSAPGHHQRAPIKFGQVTGSTHATHIPPPTSENSRNGSRGGDCLGGLAFPAR